MSRFYTYIAVIFALFLLAPVAQADVTGIWSTVDGKSHVKIEPCGDKFCGKIIWLKVPNNKEGKPKVDANNTDDALKTRAILGMELLKGFEATEGNEWDDGQIYNPEDGKTYSSTMNLVSPKVLDVKGCVLFFCKTQTWNKVE